MITEPLRQERIEALYKRFAMKWSKIPLDTLLCRSVDFLSPPHTDHSSIAPQPEKGKGENSQKQSQERAATLNLVVVDELIHSSRPKCTFQNVRYCHCGVDVAHQLCLALRCIRPFAEKDDLGLLRNHGGATQGFSKSEIRKKTSKKAKDQTKVEDDVP